MKKLFISLSLTLAILAVNAQADTTLKEYTGRYVFPDGNIVADVTIALEGGELYITSTAGTSLLTKLGVDSFSIVDFSGTAVFKRKDTGQLSGIHIEAAGYIMDGVKEEGAGIAYRYFIKPSIATAYTE